MSTQPALKTNGHDRKLAGVRTYRGRKLEDLIPQIREELGPDAIILRQREGLTGGVGGLFAQKCVGVDAQAAGPTQVDIYDEDPDDDFEIPPAPDALAEAAGDLAEVVEGEPAPVDPDVLFESFATRLEQAASQVSDMSELAAAVGTP